MSDGVREAVDLRWTSQRTDTTRDYNSFQQGAHIHPVISMLSRPPNKEAQIWMSGRRPVLYPFVQRLQASRSLFSCLESWKAENDQEV